VHAGLDLAALCGASVIALKVVSHYPRSYLEGSDLLDIKEAKRIEEQWTNQAQTLLNGVKAFGHERKVVSRPNRPLRPGGRVDCGDGQKHDCDLIVMASHGRKGCSACCWAAKPSMC
jgi:nucleotide-binding universal stress UspA family protein